MRYLCKDCDKKFDKPIIVEANYIYVEMCPNCMACEFIENNQEESKKKKPECPDCGLFVGAICISPSGCYYKK